MEQNLKNDYIEKIEAALSMIRPYLQADGGDVAFVNLTDELIVQVRLLGTCNGCPMSLQTLKAGVEQTIKRSIPDIKEVVSV